MPSVHKILSMMIATQVQPLEIKNGLRYAPNSNEKSTDCVLFLGCSFTFGEGLEDTTTLTYYFNQLAGQKFKVLNYGFHRYSPNQVLSNIENRVSDDVNRCSTKKLLFAVICQMLTLQGLRDIHPGIKMEPNTNWQMVNLFIKGHSQTYRQMLEKCCCSLLCSEKFILKRYQLLMTSLAPLKQL